MRYSLGNVAKGEQFRWTPLPLDAVVDLFRAAGFTWWISGGHALELHAGHSWRAHADTDVGVCRQDLPRVAGLLDGWDLRIASDGELRTWDPTAPPSVGNNLWCRSSSAGGWQVDVTIDDGDEHRWVYRRDPSLTRPWDEAVLRSQSGIPYLAPELQLLFKSKSIRPKDQLDAEHMIPLLDDGVAAWLSAHLDSGHPWISIINARSANQR